MISKRFQEFDAFAASVRDVDCRMLVQNPQRRIWSIDQVKLDGMHVQSGQVGSGNIVEGQSWSDGYLLYLPLTEGVEYLANGSAIDKNAVAIFEPGCDFILSTKVAHDWCTIFVPTDRIIRKNSLPGSSIDTSTNNKPRLRATRADPHLAKQFLSAVNQILVAAKNSSRFSSSHAAEFASQELCRIATSFVGLPRANQARQRGRPKANRARIITVCKELIEQQAGEPLRVEQMADAAEVSERTLQSAFIEYFGIPPARYLQLQQLNHVHHALRRAHPACVSVSDVLVDHGVWEFGRFASRYRQLFDELPSQTLRASKSPSHRGDAPVLHT